MNRQRNGFSAMALAAGLLGALPAAAADENVMIVFDGSNSMWGQIDGTAKIEIARGVMDNLLGDWTETRKVGLMAYGHRRRGDCTDIETLVAPGEGTRAGILDRIDGITPTGKTPLTDAVEQAARTLSYTDAPATVVLISDGLESCERDPCAVSEVLAQAGVGFTAHVVGFGLGDADASALSCIAEKTGGQYLSARNAYELGAALSAVGSAVAAAPEPEPEPEPAYDVTVNAPDSTLTGAAFDVSWTGTVHPRDFVTIVPMGADEGASGNYFRVGEDDSTKSLKAPAETGLYEVRYVLNEGKRTMASQTIEITEPEVSVIAPDSTLTGAAFDVSWTGTVHPRDFVTIVPMGADEGASDNYFRVGEDDGTKSLKAPAETGLYEVRYVLNEGKRTMASQPIEITEPEVSVDAPGKHADRRGLRRQLDRHSASARLRHHRAHGRRRGRDRRLLPRRRKRQHQGPQGPGRDRALRGALCSQRRQADHGQPAHRDHRARGIGGRALGNPGGRYDPRGMDRSCASPRLHHHRTYGSRGKRYCRLLSCRQEESPRHAGPGNDGPL